MAVLELGALEAEALLWLLPEGGVVVPERVLREYPSGVLGLPEVTALLARLPPVLLIGS